jgi:hypothetical protein
MTTRYRKLWALTGLAFFVLVVSSSVGVTQVNFTLTVTKAGTGSGTVTSDPPGIDCGNNCTARFPRGTVVTLTAKPASGSTVSSWSGCDSTSTDKSQCTVTMNRDRSVTVTFSTTAKFKLTVTVSGNGSVSSSPAGINNCRGTCSALFNPNETVTLTASPDSGWSFSGWSDACSGTGTCQITMDADKSVKATFTQKPVLTVKISDTSTGSGTVTSSPSGINCGSVCSAPFDPGTLVILKAEPNEDSTVSKWSRCDFASQDNTTCTVRMTADKEVTVTFTRALPTCYGYTRDTEGTFGPDLCQPIDSIVNGVKIRGDGNGNFEDGPNACPKAGCGNDRIVGTAGNDTIFGDDGLGGVPGTGHDWIMGGGGNDEINGEEGDDIIIGGDGDDEIDGGTGNDVIDGRFGVDTLAGGGGNDTFIIRAGNPSAGKGATTIICTQGPGESGKVLVRGDFKARIPFGTYRTQTTVVIEDRSVSFSSPMIYEVDTGPGKCIIKRG